MRGLPRRGLPGPPPLAVQSGPGLAGVWRLLWRQGFPPRRRPDWLTFCASSGAGAEHRPAATGRPSCKAKPSAHTPDGAQVHRRHEEPRRGGARGPAFPKGRVVLVLVLVLACAALLKLRAGRGPGAPSTECVGVCSSPASQPAAVCIAAICDDYACVQSAPTSSPPLRRAGGKTERARARHNQSCTVLPRRPPEPIDAIRGRPGRSPAQIRSKEGRFSVVSSDEPTGICPSSNTSPADRLPQDGRPVWRARATKAGSAWRASCGSRPAAFQNASGA